ncbi:MAG TPA: alpha/beta hydrolase, partial [Phycisphaerales bacterium]|nr:alpha/beta hydrolase [Phycisphaerales bacterium]
IVVEDTQHLAGPDSPIIIGTNHSGWDPSDRAYRMEPRSDGRWQLILEKPTKPGRMQFKFTRGNWDRVETAADGSDLANRTLPKVKAAEYADGHKPIFEFVVEKWADQKPGAAVTVGITDPTVPLEVTGVAHRLQLVGGAGRASGAVRDAIVWLPPGYGDAENAGRAYPVLYMLDGQHVFMQQPGAPGEWRADETATAMIRDGVIEPIIIVGIPNAGRARADEYLPAGLIDDVEPSADAFVAWIEQRVMPRVERAFRVKAGPEHTAIGGASFGGVFALYASSERPDLFGKAIVESPSVLSRDGLMLKRFLTMKRWPEVVFIGMGDTETGAAGDELNLRYVEAAGELAQAAGDAGSRVEMVIGDNAVHDENAWAERFGAALEHLFGTGQIRR